MMAVGVRAVTHGERLREITGTQGLCSLRPAATECSDHVAHRWVAVMASHVPGVTNNGDETTVRVKSGSRRRAHRADSEAVLKVVDPTVLSASPFIAGAAVNRLEREISHRTTMANPGQDDCAPIAGPGHSGGRPR